MWPLGLLSVACTPGIVMVGDELLREEALAAIRTASISRDQRDCAQLEVTLDRTDDDRIAVVIRESSGRRIERSVQSVEMIAALVEAWSTVPAELIEEPEPEQIAVALPLVPIEVTAAPPAVEPRARSMFLLSLDAEVGVGDDGSILAGPVLGGCLRLGMFCIDLAGRFLYGRTIGERESIHVRRSELEGVVGTRIELKAGSIVIAPGLATGIAWYRVSPPGDAPPLACPELDPCQVGPGSLQSSINLVRLRAHAAVSFFFPLDDVFQMEAIAGASLSPFAEEIATPGFKGQVFRSSVLIDEPRWSFRLAVGVRIGL